MREIKYQAYVKSIGECFPVEYLHIVSKEAEVRINNEPITGLYSYSKDHEEIILRQFTGLHDKNGKEIYEGDVLKARVDDRNILTCEVVFESPSFSRKWLNENTANLRGQKVEALAWNTHILYEVIGNVYENPELLEQTS